jgi:cardiolipin synthase
MVITNMPLNAAKETIFLQGEKYFESLLLDISHAQQQIDIETYIFGNDPLSERVISALIAAAQQGVKVRILVDGAGTPGWRVDTVQKLKSANIETRVYHPFLWRLWQWRHAIIQLPFLYKIFYFIWQANKRNHRKVCTIDHKIVYIGSANITQCHMNIAHGGKNWRDTIVKLTDVDVTELENAFYAAWSHLAIPEHLHHMFERINVNAVIRLNYTRRRRRVLYKNLLRRMSRCKKRIWITNAYFLPDNFILKKLKDLAR